MHSFWWYIYSSLGREFDNVKKQLSSELADKKHLVKSYSQQLEECQKTAIQLRQELSKVSKIELAGYDVLVSGEIVSEFIIKRLRAICFIMFTKSFAYILIK